MSNPAEKPEVVQLPAETPIAPPVNNRRAAAQRVREARDRLTSTSGTRPAFDRELLRVAFKPIKGSKIGELAANFEIVLGRTPDDRTLQSNRTAPG